MTLREFIAMLEALPHTEDCDVRFSDMNGEQWIPVNATGPHPPFSTVWVSLR